MKIMYTPVKPILLYKEGAYGWCTLHGHVIMTSIVLLYRYQKQRTHLVVHCCLRKQCSQFEYSYKVIMLIVQMLFRLGE